jgi:superfamily II DNA or RNA helicase
MTVIPAAAQKPTGTTSYHARFWAESLTLAGANASLGQLTATIAGSRLDLNPHQIDAALFALRSPLSQGVMLADEVGLGKTIEAGLVILQRWAERKRRILLILPATLRVQWQRELSEKFGLPAVIMEAASANRLRKSGQQNPFDQAESIVITSYHYAATAHRDIAANTWDLVVFDEAHRLRNVYKGTKLASALLAATKGRPKLLLTATPFQNSLLELYGLMSFIDPHVFGDLDAYRERFVQPAARANARTALQSNGDYSERLTPAMTKAVASKSDAIQSADPAVFTELRSRLKPSCTRTLRAHVREFIKFTARIPLTQEFTPTDAEHQLYEDVSAYLQREVIHALPKSQRALMTLVLRKLLASSSFAIASTLRRIAKRMDDLIADLPADDSSTALAEDVEHLDELRDEWDDDEAEDDRPPSRAALSAEREMLYRFADQAESIAQNTKGSALLQALGVAFRRLNELGAKQKAVIFTESRRTQQYLAELLTANGYTGRIVLINGTNTDQTSKEVYRAWLARRSGSANGAVPAKGSPSADMKAALIEEFASDRATILLATEVAAEGVNLQFCSLIVNYDLPWNPQRVEQRIGRCHRYGQKHDVVVVNFLNKRNAADQRVYELLNEKFRLFDGVFGASDEVLGALESGVDVERAIARVYQTCRSTKEIDAAFDQLQADLEQTIQARMSDTRHRLLDNFDAEVHERLAIHHDAARQALDRIQTQLWSLLCHELADVATFADDHPRLLNDGQWYNLDWRDAERRGDTFVRPGHDLAERICTVVLARPCATASLRFTLTGHTARIAALETLRGRSGWLACERFIVEHVNREEFLLLVGFTDDQPDLPLTLDTDQITKLFQLPATTEATDMAETDVPPTLESTLTALATTKLAEVETRNVTYFDEEVQKLDAWADDRKWALDQEIKALNAEIAAARKASTGQATLADKVTALKRVKDLESKRVRKRRELFEAEDEIDRQRGDMITGVEARLRQTSRRQPAFRVRWQVV